MSTPEPSDWLPNDVVPPYRSPHVPKKTQPGARSYLVAFALVAAVVGGFLLWNRHDSANAADTGSQIDQLLRDRGSIASGWVTGYDKYADGVAVRVDMAGTGATYQRAANVICAQVGARDFATDTPIYVLAPDTLDPVQCTNP